jgi:hypothetical protein
MKGKIRRDLTDVKFYIFTNNIILSRVDDKNFPENKVIF